MKPVGKTYLLEAYPPKDQIVDGVYIPTFGDPTKMTYFIGKVIEYGTGFTDEQKQQLVPVGTTVIMDYTKNVHKTKLIMDGKVFYIYPVEGVLAIIENWEEL